MSWPTPAQKNFFMNNQTDEQLLNGFLAGSLNQSEIKDLSTRRMTNPDLDRKLRLASAIDDPLLDWQSLQLRKKLADIHKKEDSYSGLLYSFVKRKFAIPAAAAMFVILVGVVYFFNNSPVNSDNLYTAYYEPVKPFFMQRSTNVVADESTDFARGMQCYDSKNFSDAAKLLSGQADNMAARFYLAISMMELGNFKKASENLSVVAADQSNLFNDQATWYLALSYLKMGDLEKTRTELKRIASAQSYYNDKALELLEKL